MDHPFMQHPAPRLLSDLLEEGGAWPLESGLRLVHLLTVQVRSLHESGRLHLAIDGGAVTLDAQLRPKLAAGPRSRRFGGGESDPEFCPPELAREDDLELPESIDGAARLLAEGGRRLDPRRIDVYQLAVLLCHALTGESVRAYMYRPEVKAAVPDLVRPPLERALGFAAQDRFETCDQLLNALDEVLERCGADRDSSLSRETPPRGSAVDLTGDTPPQGDLAPHRPRPSIDALEKPPFPRLGRYRVLARVGSGGMGDVYRGIDESLDREVGIKVLPNDLAQHEDFVQRFRAEAMAAAKLAHPNVVPIFSIDEDGGRHFFVMQYVEGESLAARLDREKRLPVAKAVRLVEQCLAGLEAAHNAGLIHRDIKPANILLDCATERALLVDFGLVRRMGESERLTATGVIMGTVDYIAPEQARGHNVDGRADLYALGVLLYHALSGRLPFEAETPTAMIFQHAYEDPRPLDQIAPELPPPILAIVARMMAKEPQNRYQTARAVLTDLEAFREGRPLSPIAVSSSLEPSFAFADEPALPEPIADLTGEGLWRRARDWAATLFRRHAPEVVQRLQSTTQQIELAIGHYQRRRRHLERLLSEASRLRDDLAEQLDSNRKAAAKLAREAGSRTEAADHESVRAKQHRLEEDIAAIETQYAEQRQQAEELELQLGKTRATLARLLSQQDTLRARLRLAQAQLHLEGKRNSRPRLPLWRRLGAVAALLLAISVLCVIVWKKFMPSSPPAGPAAPLVSLSPPPIPARSEAVVEEPKALPIPAPSSRVALNTPVRPERNPRSLPRQPRPKTPENSPCPYYLHFSGKHYVELDDAKCWEGAILNFRYYVRIAPGHGEARLLGTLAPPPPTANTEGWALVWVPEPSSHAGHLAVEYVTFEGKTERIKSNPITPDNQWHHISVRIQGESKINALRDLRPCLEGECRGARIRGKGKLHLGCPPWCSQPFYGDIWQFDMEGAEDKKLDFRFPREDAILDFDSGVIHKLVGATWTPPVQTVPEPARSFAMMNGKIVFVDSDGLVHLDKTFTAELWIKNAGDLWFGDSTWRFGIVDRPPEWPCFQLRRGDDQRFRSAPLKNLDKGWHHIALANTPGKTIAYFDGAPMPIEIEEPVKYRNDAEWLEPHRLTLFVNRNQVRAFRLSSSLRYTGPFAPPKDFAPDPETLILPDFSHQVFTAILDLSGHRRDGLKKCSWSEVTD